MSPRGLDAPAVRRRLTEMARLLDWLDTRAPEVDGAALRDDLDLRLAAERVLIALVEMATQVNLHLVRAVGRTPPDGYADGFRAMGEAGLVDTELANELAPAGGSRNALVHAYLDLDLDMVASAIEAARRDLRTYVLAVGEALERLERSADEG